jgi:putative peptide zinc metalloprotease protein
MPDAPASDLERRKKIRLRIRADLAIAPQKYEGRTYYVVKDPVSLRYYRFKEHEHFLIRLMDGRHTLDDAQKEFEKRFRPDRLTLEDLEQFGQQLLTAGLAQNESPQAGKQLYDRRAKRRRMEWLQTLTNILYIKIPLFDPEKILTKMLPYLRWMFTFTFFLVSVGFMLAAAFLVLTHFQTFRDRLPSYQEFFSFKTIAYMWIALGIVKVIHEFGHGLSCKAFGGEVHEMGFLILCFSPAMYCNVSDAWTLPNKWHRIIISFAGIYVELMIAAAATFIWWNSPSHPFVNYMALALMVVCSVSTVFFNGNPLMRYDGYYVLADWLEIPNLRDRANRYLQRLVMEHCLGIETQPEPYMELSRRILFLTYAVISWVYRWVVTFVILKFMATFLKPYKLEIISNMLAAAALASMVGWPLFRLAKNIHKRGRLPDMKNTRVIITSTVLAAVLLGFFFWPLPVSRVRHTGLIQIQDNYSEAVHVNVPGRLEKINVEEGQIVKAGDTLAEFSSEKLSSDLAEAQTQLEIKTEFLRALDRRPPTADKKELERLEQTRLQTQAELIQAKQRTDNLIDEIGKLTLKAKRAGVVYNIPKQEELNKFWEKDQGTPFCTIGDPTKPWVLVPIPPDNYDILRDNDRKLNPDRKKPRQNHLPVTLRVHGRDSQTWSGRIVYWPEAAAREVPLALSNKGGGPLAVQQSKEGKDKLEPQAQVYLVGIAIDNPDDAICPGVLAQVKITCEYRSAAWWVWRLVSSTFDIGLL